MKVVVRIGEQTFAVEVEDVHARPVIATVDGERFEVWPENGTAGAAAEPIASREEVSVAGVASRANGGASAGDLNTVYAPIPGVIVGLSVQPGDVVEVGQELCVLEAMKMKNAIRAARAGEIASVHIALGQHVRHHDVLVEFAG